MAEITYVEFDGTEHTIEVSNGKSVMQGAVQNDVPGIDADCGGACACATCHVYVDPEWLAVVGTASEIEKDLMDCVEDPAPNSRLSCQIQVSDELDGLRVTIPKAQG